MQCRSVLCQTLLLGRPRRGTASDQMEEPKTKRVCTRCGKPLAGLVCARFRRSLWGVCAENRQQQQQQKANLSPEVLHVPRGGCHPRYGQHPRYSTPKRVHMYTTLPPCRYMRAMRVCTKTTTKQEQHTTKHHTNLVQQQQLLMALFSPSSRLAWWSFGECLSTPKKSSRMTRARTHAHPSCANSVHVRSGSSVG